MNQTVYQNFDIDNNSKSYINTEENINAQDELGLNCEKVFNIQIRLKIRLNLKENIRMNLKLKKNCNKVHIVVNCLASTFIVKYQHFYNIILFDILYMFSDPDSLIQSSNEHDSIGALTEKIKLLSEPQKVIKNKNE